MIHMNVGKFAEENNCYEGRDEELDTNVLDEDKLLDLLEVFFQQQRQAKELLQTFMFVKFSLNVGLT